MGGPADGRTRGDGAARVRQSPRPTIRPDRHPPRRRAPRRPDAARFGARHDAAPAREPVAAGFALPGRALHGRDAGAGRRPDRHQSAACGGGVRTVGVGGFGPRRARQAVLRPGGPDGDRPGGRAIAARLPGLAAPAARRFHGRARVLRHEGRRERLRAHSRSAGRGRRGRRVQESGHLLRSPLRHGAGGPGRRHDPDARRQPDEVRGARLDLCRAGARREERVASRRDAHASQGHGLRRPGSTGHERSLQGAGGALRHARRGGASAATPQDAARRAAVRGGGAVTPPRVDADTPLMQQYREIKARHPDAILFFRMGDFYEMFEDDAQLAARELGLTLTSRNNGGAAEVPLAGVPVKAATDYLRRLIAQGHRVAICEQVEDPKLAKGLVRREVVETITPGTVLAEDWLERKRNNFLLALDPRGTAPGLAALDLSTGELALETVPPEDLASALARYEAPEVVLPTGCELAGQGACTVTEREAWEFDPELAREDLVRVFRLASLDGLGVEPGDRAAVGAAGALLRYARELKPGGLPHLAPPRVLRRGDVLPRDEMTRRNPEPVEPARPGATGATLVDMLDRTMTPMGAALPRRWLLTPLVDPAAINARLDAVDVLVHDPRARDRVREALDGVRDLERLAGRAALGRATPRELGALRDSIFRLPDVRSALDGLEARGAAAPLERAAERF